MNLRYSSAQVEGMHTGGKRQCGDPGERATVGDTFWRIVTWLPWTVPRLSSEFHQGRACRPKADCPGCPWWLLQRGVTLAHDIAGTGQLTGCRAVRLPVASTEPLFAHLSACR